MATDLPLTPGNARNGAMNGGQWNYDRVRASFNAGISFPPNEDMTQQQFKDEADINVIVKRFGLSGVMPENVRVPVSGDFCGVDDFQSAMNAVKEAERNFMALPAHVRAEFDNSPQKLMMFMADEKNRARALELGLINKPPERTRDVVQAVDELAAHFKADLPKK